MFNLKLSIVFSGVVSVTSFGNNLSILFIFLIFINILFSVCSFAIIVQLWDAVYSVAVCQFSIVAPVARLTTFICVFALPFITVAITVSFFQ